MCVLNTYCVQSMKSLYLYCVADCHVKLYMLDVADISFMYVVVFIFKIWRNVETRNLCMVYTNAMSVRLQFHVFFIFSEYLKYYSKSFLFISVFFCASQYICNILLRYCCLYHCPWKGFNSYIVCKWMYVVTYVCLKLIALAVFCAWVTVLFYNSNISLFQPFIIIYVFISNHKWFRSSYK